MQSHCFAPIISEESAAMTLVPDMAMEIGSLIPDMTVEAGMCPSFNMLSWY